MPLSGNGKRVLVCRAEALEAGGFVDDLCNGLVSRFQASPIPGARVPKRGEFVWLKPVYARVSDAFVWSDPTEIPWERLKKWIHGDSEVFYFGSLSDKEKSQGRAQFPELKAWEGTA